ncbi:alpha-1A adrenergic receptor-like [Clytia hemisphaerica]|uniref:alpha-1A adrenergic receptor-like n=1 Tax=Clytia hemisphaerica TaxID=252671 RepID=UPI0034D685DD
MSLTSPVPAINVTFFCCLSNALSTGKFGNVHHLHNLTYHCQEHTDYGSKEEYIKKVIKVFWIDRHKHQNIFNCNGTSNSLETIYRPPQAVQFPANVCRQRIQLEFNFYIIIWLIIFILGIIGNSLVLAAFCKSKKLQANIENHFVVSLAVTDLLLILFIVPIKIDYALHNFLFCSTLNVCRLYLITDHVFFSASILSIFALTISRYITIIHPYDYRKIVNPVAAKLVVGLIWIIAITFGIISNVDAEHNTFDGIMIENNQCQYRHLNQITTYVLYVVVFFLPCSVMTVLYCHLYYISNKHTKTIRLESKRIPKKTCNLHSKDTASTSSNGSAYKKHRRSSSGKISFIIQQSASFINKKLETRATRVLLLLYGSFVACWLPIILIIFLQAGGIIQTIPFGVYALLHFLTTLHSTIDPFIYGVLHREFKSTLKKMLGITILSYQRRGSGCRKSMSTYRSNLEVPTSYLATHRDSRDSNSSFNLNTPRTPEKTEDGYPIYKIRFFDELPSPGHQDTPKIILEENEDEEENQDECEEQTGLMENLNPCGDIQNLDSGYGSAVNKETVFMLDDQNLSQCPQSITAMENKKCPTNNICETVFMLNDEILHQIDDFSGEHQNSETPLLSDQDANEYELVQSTKICNSSLLNVENSKEEDFPFLKTLVRFKNDFDETNKKECFENNISICENSVVLENCDHQISIC